MMDRLTGVLNFQSQALLVRADRQRVIASNIANADTPGFAGRDINFKAAMQSALGMVDPLKLPMVTPLGGSGKRADGVSHPQHIPIEPIGDGTGYGKNSNLEYTTQIQPAMDGNSVDMDRERTNFVDNSVRYEAALRFINGTSKTMLSAIQGQ